MIVADIPNYPEYAVTSDGRIFKKSDSSKKELAQVVNHAGYKCVSLTNEQGRKQVKVHRLVMQAFAPIPDMYKHQVNHKDGNKHNNSLDNLEWCTQTENMQHAIRTGLKVIEQQGERNYNHKLNWSAVEYIRTHFDKERCTCADLGKMFGVHQTTIKYVVDNKTWKAQHRKEGDI